MIGTHFFLINVILFIRSQFYMLTFECSKPKTKLICLHFAMINSQGVWYPYLSFGLHPLRLSCLLLPNHYSRMNKMYNQWRHHHHHQLSINALMVNITWNVHKYNKKKYIYIKATIVNKSNKKKKKNQLNITDQLTMVTLSYSSSSSSSSSSSLSFFLLLSLWKMRHLSLIDNEFKNATHAIGYQLSIQHYKKNKSNIVYK